MHDLQKINDNMKSIILILYFLCLIVSENIAQNISIELDNIFEIVEVLNKPVITKGDKGTESNIYGFEGGRAIKYNNEYHLFTTEMSGIPIWTKTILAYWKSKDGIHWKRVSTLFESTGNFDGTNTHACLWSPMPTFCTNLNRWVLTFVAYRSKPNTDDAWYRNYDGRIVAAVSQKEGKKYLKGPYSEKAILMEPGANSAKWEGLMGVDSFFPFQTKDGWMAFYGSSPEINGLAKADDILGKWERISMQGYVSQHTENPIVTNLDDGRFIAFFDGCGFYQKFGYMLSKDGITWSKPVIIDLDKHPNKWWGLTRTPLGLISEGNGRYTLFFTAYNKNFYNIPGIWAAKSDSVFDGYFASVGIIKLKLKIGGISLTSKTRAMFGCR
jgi:hypothetical protein